MVRQGNIKIRMLTGAILLAIAGADLTLHAQFFELIPLHEFENRKSIPITCGRVIGFSDDSIEIEDGNNIHHGIRIKDLSTADQQFVRSLRDSLKVFRKQQNEADKLAHKLNSGSDKLKFRALNKLKSLGPAARQHTELVVGVGNSDDVDFAASALETYMIICPADKASYEKVVTILANDPRLFNAFQDSPQALLEQLVKFGSHAEGLLIHAAFTGEIDLEAKGSAGTKPAIFTTIYGPKNKIRASAARALCQIRTDIANKATIAIVSAASRPINGRWDTETIRQTLIGCEKSARSTVLFSTFAKFKTSFPQEYAAWTRSHKKREAVRKESERLIRSSKMRSFSDQNGSFLVRGSVEAVSDNRVLLTNHHLQRVAIDFIKFSKADQTWIVENQKK